MLMKKGTTATEIVALSSDDSKQVISSNDQAITSQLKETVSIDESKQKANVVANVLDSIEKIESGADTRKKDVPPQNTRKEKMKELDALVELRVTRKKFKGQREI